MAAVPYVTSRLRISRFQAAWFLLDSLYVFLISQTTCSGCLDPCSLYIIIFIHFSSRYQFLSTPLFPSACDVLLLHFIRFGSIITLVWFHLFYFYTDIFFNDIELTSLSLSLALSSDPFSFILPTYICISALYLFSNMLFSSWSRTWVIITKNTWLTFNVCWSGITYIPNESHN
jgi:hypothetical protein